MTLDDEGRMGDDSMDAARRARWALALGIAALVVWPLSYANLLSPDRPRLIFFALVPIAQVTALVLGYLAIEFGIKARRAGAPGASSLIAIALGALVLTVIVAGTVLDFLQLA
jgi:uncharacterized membrane protein YhdT